MRKHWRASSHTPLNVLRWLTQVLLVIVVVSLLGVAYALWQVFQVKTPLPRVSERSAQHGDATWCGCYEIRTGANEWRQ
jgi:hypothetical protein